MAFEIEVGKIAFLKTSEEPVFVLKLGTDSESGAPTAIVRRPIQSDNGVLHSTETFYSAELHSAEQKLMTEIDFQKFMLAQRDKMTRERQEKDAAERPSESYLN